MVDWGQIQALGQVMFSDAYFFDPPINIMESNSKLTRMRTISGHCMLIPIILLFVLFSKQLVVVKIIFLIVGIPLWTYRVEWGFNHSTGHMSVQRHALGILIQSKQWELKQVRGIEIVRAGRGDGSFDYILNILTQESGVIRFARRGNREKILRLKDKIITCLPPNIECKS
jgi:hypothetical protein